MNNSTTLDDLVFIVNTTDANNTLLSPIPLSTIVTITVCSFGIMANFLVLLVIILTFLRTSVFMNLIMYLAIFDTIFLFSVILVRRGIFGELLIKPSFLYCCIIKFSIYVTGIVSSWVTVLISFERYNAIFHPFKVHVHCTRKKMLMAVIMITILACTSQIPIFFTCSLIFIGQQPKCLSSVSNTWTEFIFIFLTFMLYSFVPLIIITILNILLIRKIQVQDAFRARSKDQHSASKSSMKTRSLVAIMVCLLNHIALMLNDINHGVNFFLYCLTGSVFRQAFFQLFKCK